MGTNLRATARVLRSNPRPDRYQIETVTHSLCRPCVMDLKVAVQTVESDEVNVLKRLNMAAGDVVTSTESAGVYQACLSM